MKRAASGVALAKIASTTKKRKTQNTCVGDKDIDQAQCTRGK